MGLKIHGSDFKGIFAFIKIGVVLRFVLHQTPEVCFDFFLYLFM